MEFLLAIWALWSIGVIAIIIHLNNTTSGLRADLLLCEDVHHDVKLENERLRREVGEI